MKNAIHTLLALALFAIGWSWGKRVEVDPPNSSTTTETVVADVEIAALSNVADDLRNALGGDMVTAQIIATQLNERDPAQTLRILAVSGAGPRAQALFESAFTALAKRDLAIALRFYREHPPLRNLLDLKNALVEAAEKDGTGAWQLFQQQRDLLGLPALRAIAGGWARRDPSAAMIAGSSITDESERATFLGEVFAGWARKDTKAFLAWIKTQTLDSIVTSLGGQQQWLSGQLDMGTLRDLAATLPSETLRQAGWQDTLAAALLDPNQRRAAPEWIRKLIDPKLRDDSWRALASAMLKAGQATGIAALMSEATTMETRTAIASMAAVALAVKQPLDAMKFVDGLTEPRAAEMARYSVFDTWMSHDKKAAREWAKAHYSELPEDQRRHLLMEAVSSDPISMATWAQTQGETGFAETVTKSAASLLYSRSPSEAIAWLGTLPAGPVRDAAVCVMASYPASVPTFDFPSAMRLGSQLSAAQKRTELALQILERWRYLDAKGAQAWLSSPQASPLLGAEGFVKARELLAKPLPKFPAGNTYVGDDFGTWQPNAVSEEIWRIGENSVDVYY